MDYNTLIKRIFSSLLILVIFFYIIFFNEILLKYLVSLIFFIILIEIFKNFKNKIDKIILLFYILISFIFLQLYFIFFYQVHIFIFYCLIIMLFDTSSYIFGTTFGEKKIFKKISPKKTFFGFYSGFFITIIISLTINYFLNIFSAQLCIVFIFYTIMLAFIGDILESFFKRKSNLKNSGNIIPGHGGFFDRFDSFILNNYGLLIFSYLIY